jgi:hypothetical protein
MPHPLVDQLRFTRSEFVRGLAQVADPEAQRRFESMNCISWMVGHLAWQEQRYWLQRAQRQVILPQLNQLLAYGKPASTPPVAEMWAAWRQITQAADPWLDALTTEKIETPLVEGFSSIGTFLHRVIYHYWYHLGEGTAVRQLLGHAKLPDFVGDIDSLAPYRPEQGGQPREILSKDQFINKVQAARSRWEALLAQFGDDRMLEPGASENWSVKDIIAHITWHDREMVGLLRSRALAGSDLWNLPLEERNQAIYAEIRDLPLERVRAEANEVYRQLIRELEGLADEELHDPGRFAEMPSDWRPVDILTDNTYQHYLDHFLSLQEWLKQFDQA